MKNMQWKHEGKHLFYFDISIYVLIPCSNLSFRNAEILDKKRSSEFEAIRRLQFNAMKKMSSMQQSIKQQMMQHAMF